MLKILVQSEFENTRYYYVTLQDKKRDDRCQCGGTIQYLGNKKNGEPKYRKQYNCFHVRIARENREKEFISFDI